MVDFLFWNENPFKSALFFENCTLLWGNPVRNICEESETREEEILKALEHHQTGKTSTHSWAEKALRSSQASLNGSLSANCANQPPPNLPTLQRTTLLLLSTHMHTSAEGKSGRACSLFLWSFHFTGKWFIPKVLWFLPSVWRFCVLFPSPQKASYHTKQIKHKH